VQLHSTALLSLTIAAALRILARTWRLRLHDEAGLLGRSKPGTPVIWVLWHNRIIVIPIVYERFFRHRPGVVLISRSRDGGILAGCIERFGGVPVRGSSSRGGASALRELQRRIAEGWDAYITPDGPKGPRYSFSPGALWLGKASGAALMPVSIECSSCWRLGRWDGFIIPKPFAKVEVTLRPPHQVPPGLDEDSVKGEQERLRDLLMSHTGLH